jgi:hypothetical protein
MSMRRWLATFSLGLVFVLGWLVFASVVVIRVVVLNHKTYTTTLVSTRAYDRFYTEVLADPEVARLQEELLGRLGLGAFTSAEVRVFANNVLRLSVPPSVLRSGTEVVIANVLAYVRGDTRRLDVDVAVSSVFAKIDDAAVVEARTALAAAADRVVTSLPALEAAVRAFADDLAAGTVPASIPVVGGSSFDPGQVAAAILDGLGPLVTPEVRQQVLAAVVAGDQRDALISTASSFVATHAARISTQLAEQADPAGRLNVVKAITDHAQQPVGKVVASLDPVRDATRWFTPLTAVVGAVLALVAAAGLVWMHRRSRTRLLAILGSTLVAAGLVQLLLWTLAAHLVPTPFDDAVPAGPSSWHLPAGLRALLRDIQDTLTHDVLRAVIWMSLVAIVPGVLLAIAAAIPVARRHTPAVAVTGGLAVVLVVATPLVTIAVVRPSAERACNGHVELCDRPYNDVVFAATHNAMSSPDVVRLWPEQDDNLSEQLDAGVRALLIDTHYWLPVRSPSDLINVQQAVDAAEPLLPRSVANALYPTLGTLRNGRDGTYLCHLQCAFGAIPFRDGMVTVRQFLEANPDEIVTLIIQDAISNVDTEAAMHAAGLDPYLYQPRANHTWPTLGQMIDTGQRLVVFAEEAGPPPPWYANAFEEMQETPYTVSSATAFTCAPNRGRADAPLFLLNHWVARVPPDRVNASLVNTRAVLVARARQCENQRGLRPNFIAVDFSNIGDVVGAVNELNGVR